jgi:2-C-methyl-D-erythritol 4-phosphate cytidylyltransferase
MPDFAAILPAAGLSTRFGGPSSKLLAEIAGQSVLMHSLAAFQRRPDMKFIVVAAQSDIRSYLPSTVTICDGGTCRAGSVLNALRHVPESIEWVAVHDAARPLVSQELINRTLFAAAEHGAAVPALPVVQTIKRAAGSLPAKVLATVPRENLYLMQTPQIMRRADLLAAFEQCPVPLERITDDAQLLELSGRDVWLVAGEESNLKITTQADLALARSIWANRQNPGAVPSDMS